MVSVVFQSDRSRQSFIRFCLLFVNAPASGPIVRAVFAGFPISHAASSLVSVISCPKTAPSGTTSSRTGAKSARRYGFVEWDGPVLEPTELFKRKAAPEIVSQLFNFTDKGEPRSRACGPS